MKFKTGDKVIVLAGKDKGKSGPIVHIFRENNKAVVEGVNLLKQHKKVQNKKEGGIIEAPAPIDISNLAIVDPKDNRPSRIGWKVDKDGKKTRIAKKSGTKL